MDSTSVCDTVIQVKTITDTVIKVDTVYAFASKKASSIQSIAPWIGLGLTVVGWFIGLILTRVNNKKSFRESVLDRIRIEVTPSLIEYQKWLDLLHKMMMEVRTNFIRRFDNYEEARKLIVKQIEAKTSDQATLERLTMDDLDLTDLRAYLNGGPKVNFYKRFQEYEFLFPRMSSMVSSLRERHTDLIGMLTTFYTGYNPKNILDNNMDIDYLRFAIDEARVLRDQLFQVFQYECLSSMDNLDEPKFKPIHFDAIVRKDDGTLTISTSPENGINKLRELFIKDPPMSTRTFHP